MGGVAWWEGRGLISISPLVAMGLKAGGRGLMGRGLVSLAYAYWPLIAECGGVA